MTFSVTLQQSVLRRLAGSLEHPAEELHFFYSSLSQANTEDAYIPIIT